MKTPIQELIEEFRQCTSENMFIQTTINLAIEMAENKLEKEKQQTIDFANKCRIINNIDCDGNVSFIFTPELQFDKTYNAK